MQFLRKPCGFYELLYSTINNGLPNTPEDYRNVLFPKIIKRILLYYFDKILSYCRHLLFTATTSLSTRKERLNCFSKRSQLRKQKTVFTELTALKSGFVRFEVFTAVVMKSIIFWDVTPCSLLSCNRRFGGTYRLHQYGVTSQKMILLRFVLFF
jgi:hypothetical protein